MKKNKFNFTKLKNFYQTSALLLLNTLVFVILVNLFLAIVFFIKDQIFSKENPVAPTAISELASQEQSELFNKDGAPLDNDKRSSYQLKWFDYTAYEQIVDKRYAGIVLDDFFELGKLGFMYQPWIQFSEPPYDGQLLNVDVDSKGFPIRRTINPETVQSSIIRIFVLGGSTTFGYNVSDEHTWPSHLSDILNERARSNGLPIQVEVINYGRGYYNPSQETILLIDLLKSGHRPNLVIFMDGVNFGQRQDIPHFTNKLKREFHDLQFGPSSSHRVSLLHGLRWVPIIRLANSMKKRLFSRVNEDEPGIDNDDDKDKKDRVIHLVTRFNSNRKIAALISELYSTKTLFFLQPDAAYNYPLELYRRSLPESFLERRLIRQRFYNQMKTSSGIIDLSGLFKLWGQNRKAIVDDVHYSPGFSHFLAQHVADHIDLVSLMAGAFDSGDAETTGTRR